MLSRIFLFRQKIVLLIFGQDAPGLFPLDRSFAIVFGNVLHDQSERILDRLEVDGFACIFDVVQFLTLHVNLEDASSSSLYWCVLECTGLKYGSQEH